MSDNRVLFNTATVGASRDNLSTWRESVQKKLTAMKKMQQDKDDNEKALTDTYQKAMKTRKLPEITLSTWARFLFIWRSEAHLYSNDQQILSVIRSHLCDAVDKHHTEHMSSLQDFMAYLTRRYGTESAVFQSMLNDLLALHSPKNEKEEEVNLAKISALTSISTNADNMELYTMDKVKSLVTSTLLDETRHLFWNKFLECKHEKFMLLSDCYW